MHCIGIDLGTTNSLVSYWDETEGKVKLIPNEFGDTLTPSVVGFPKGAEVLVEKAAKEMLITAMEQKKCLARPIRFLLRQTILVTSFLPEWMTRLSK